MELRHLRYFVAAAEEENFHRAAIRLHIAQPALSRRIRDLEYELKVQLFERDRKRVRLSAAGRSYLTDARRMLERMELAGRRALGIANGEVGTLTIGLRDTHMRNAVVAQAISTFIAKHQEIELKLDPETHHVVADALLNGTVDAAFLYSRPRDNPVIEYVEISKERFAVALASGHPLARRRTLSLADLKNERLLWIHRDLAPAIFDKVIASCESSGFTPKIVHYGANEITRLHLVGVGMGITFVHASVVNRWPGVAIRPLTDLDVPMSLDLAWHRNKRSPSLDRLIEVVTELKALAARPAKLP